MAQMSIFLELKSEGKAVEGEPSIREMAGTDVSKMIECISYNEGVTVGYDPRTGAAHSDRTYDPIVIRKLVDKSSPLIAQAAAEARKLDGKFKFYRPIGDGGGWEHYFTVTIEDARIHRVLRRIAEGEESSPLKEDVHFVFSKIHWKHETAATEHQDDWRVRSKK